MTNSKLTLPSNRNFGFFLSFVFLAISIYFFIKINYSFILLSLSIAILILIISLTVPIFLSPFNIIWSKIGLLINLITRPIILGLIFFILITPLSIVLRIFGRDQMNLKKLEKNSYWIDRKISKFDIENFKNQF